MKFTFCLKFFLKGKNLYMVIKKRNEPLQTGVGDDIYWLKDIFVEGVPCRFQKMSFSQNNFPDLDLESDFPEVGTPTSIRNNNSLRSSLQHRKKRFTRMFSSCCRTPTSVCRRVLLSDPVSEALLSSSNPKACHSTHPL